MGIVASQVKPKKKVWQIIRKIQLAGKKLQKSSFYADFIEQIEDPKFVALIEKVIGTDPQHSQLQLVLYGVGRMDFNEEKPETDEYETEIHLECNRMQLCLAILLREICPWVSDIVVYDLVLSAADREAINSLDCNCLSVNENGKRTVDRPTLFFMPHCDVFMYGNVLEANWTAANLNKIIILGNSFSEFLMYEKYFPYYRDARAKKLKAILETDHMFHEIRLPQIAPMYGEAFDNLFWHFFDWDGSLHGFKSGGSFIPKSQVIADFRNILEPKKNGIIDSFPDCQIPRYFSDLPSDCRFWSFSKI